MPVSDATLAAIARLSVGTPVEDETDFTAMTPAEVAAKYELASYGGDGTLYALGSDGDYDALDPDLPPVTDLGLWAVGGFTNMFPNAIFAGAVTGTPGTTPTGTAPYNVTVTAVTVGEHLGLPKVTIAGTKTNDSIASTYDNSRTWPVEEGDVSFASVFSGASGAGNTGYTQFLQNNWAAGNTVSVNRALSFTLMQLTQTANAASTFQIYYSRLTFTGAGQPLEYQMAAPQVVLNTGYNPPVLALSSAATTAHLAAITQREVAVWKPFVVVIEATTGEDTGAHQVFYSLSRSADELIEIYRATSTDQITVHVRSGGTSYTDALDSVADNTAFTVALNVFASFTAASLDGGTVQVLTARKPSGVLTLESIGCKHDGTLQCNGPIADCTLIHPAIWTADQLETA